MQKFLQNRSFNFFSVNRKSSLIFAINFFISIFVIEIVNADTKNLIKNNNKPIEIKYLESRNELEDYIIDTSDSISLRFNSATELNGVFVVNEEGELFLPRIDETFVRGLTKSELKTLLEKRYAEFLIDPEIKVRIVGFKSIRVLARGELRNPGFYKFPAYQSGRSITLKRNDKSELDSLIENYNDQSDMGQNSQSNNQSTQDIVVKRSSENLTTISDVIRSAGGITSLTDLSRIVILRDVPFGKGGGKKRAIIDLNAYLNDSDATNDIRIFDGDSLFFPKLSKSDTSQIPKSILSGISPRFISVNILGRVETPGIVRLPLEAVLSDAIDLSGPIKPLSGKVVLIRYSQNGTVLKKNITYSARAKRGSERNPYLLEDDLISVKNSFFGKTTGFITEVSSPFVGIYSAQQLIKGFSN